MSIKLKIISLLVNIVLFVSLISPLAAIASPTSLILITELQTGQGSREFIEIENHSDSTLDLSQWQLQYHGATSMTWSTKTLTFTDPLVKLLEPGDRALFTASGYAPPSSNIMANFSSGFADTGGAVRFLPLDLDQSLGDILTWGTTDAPTCSIAPKHADLQSLKRFPSGDGVIVDTGSSGMDFYVSNSPSPDLIDTQDPFSIDEVVNYCGKPEDIIDDPEAPGVIEDPGNPPAPIYSKIEITELFTDPVSPQTDENDEYIELFNPNSEAINISGYTLESGINSTYSYSFGDVVIPAGEYFAISRKYSKLTLSNTSSRARLLDPNGEIISETDPYDKSYQGQSWHLYDGVWQWTTTPTPSASNFQLSLGGATTTATKVTAKPAAKKATAPKKAASKKAAAKKVSTASKTAQKDSAPTAFTYTDDQGNTKLQPYILWGAGLLLLGYGLWEYRWDLMNIVSRKK
ncbi:MAG: hypothetical protein QG623_77 [Patescibacteria group bacterium]|nr:hypothetical protein [Patescibacteria group bacterium]